MEGYNLRALLRQPLKSDTIIELLNDFELDVYYDFDRLRENGEDSYHAQAKQAGFALRFDAQQILDTIFCFIKEQDGYSPIDTVIIGAPIYRTFDETREAIAEQGVSFRTPDDSGEDSRRWLRVDLPNESIHYQFGLGSLHLVTIMASPP